MIALLNEEESESVLRPQLNMFDAVSTGLAAILGAGMFAVIAPTAAVVGRALVVSLLVAALGALCDALSSAQLAVVLPRTVPRRPRGGGSCRMRGISVLIAFVEIAIGLGILSFGLGFRAVRLNIRKRANKSQVKLGTASQ